MLFGRKMLNETLAEDSPLPVDVFGCWLIIVEGIVDFMCSIVIALQLYEKLYPALEEPEEQVEQLMDSVSARMRVIEFVCSMAIISHGINAG